VCKRERERERERMNCRQTDRTAETFSDFAKGRRHQLGDKIKEENKRGREEFF
jgi:hypothetical protein